jgi:Skp family chaperone for outer membrane proteins
LRIFLPEVAAERNALQAKAQAIQDLQAKYAQGQIKSDAYQQQYAKLQAEYLQAQVQVNMSMLDKMIASPGFADLRADLQHLKDQAKPLADQVDALVKQAQVTILDYTTFFNQLQQLQSAFQQVDQLLTQVAATKILEISQQVAQEQGYDIVLRTKDVVMYLRTPLFPTSLRKWKSTFPGFLGVSVGGGQDNKARLLRPKWLATKGAWHRPR